MVRVPQSTLRDYRYSRSQTGHDRMVTLIVELLRAPRAGVVLFMDYTGSYSHLDEIDEIAPTGARIVGTAISGVTGVAELTADVGIC
eukprot:2243035-Rhodomonas_salina.2